MLSLAIWSLALVFSGALLAETSGYVWHLWVCHLGIFRKLLNDNLRRRHFDHHMYKYHIRRLESQTYDGSCEVAFHFLGVGIIVCFMVLVLLGVLSWPVFLLIMSGALFYSIFGLGGMHKLYHLDEATVQKMWLFQWQFIWRKYVWLRDYHLIHHFVNRNYAILLPFLDKLGGTYLSPSELPQLQRHVKIRGDLFPGFDSRLSRTCGDPLF